MRVDHIPCGECVNESERVAIERLIRELNGFGTPHQRWILLSNVPSAVNDRESGAPSLDHFKAA